MEYDPEHPISIFSGPNNPSHPRYRHFCPRLLRLLHGLLGDDDSEHSSDEDFRPNSFISGALHSVADHSMPEMPI